MIMKILELIKLWLPYFLVIQLYKSNKSIPANIRTKSGRTLTAIMVTGKYGVIYSSEEYNENRLKLLRDRQLEMERAYNALMHEVNTLSTVAREEFYDAGEA